ncbi:MAG: ATP-binding cassette domain-containing protein, partial [Methanomicrobia archaeon]|nr:ATP-binding cassette domain-containing protein [Methanomicrobia archaeon]
MPEKVVEVENLVKHYKTVAAVDEISFDIYRGEIFSLVGPNGAGKTTTVEMLECLRTPTSGSAKVLGFDLLNEEMEIKKRIG